MHIYLICLHAQINQDTGTRLGPNDLNAGQPNGLFFCALTVWKTSTCLTASM